MRYSLSRCLSATLFSISLLGCTASAVARSDQTVTAQAPACIGTISAPATMTPVVDDALLANAIGGPNEGKLCMGRTYTTTAPIRVFRLWNRAQPFSLYGRWWTLESPGGSIESLRATYEVCPEWSPLDALSECTLRAGSHVVLGSGQSAQCAGSVRYGQSEALQLYIPNDTRATPEVLYVEDCHGLPSVGATQAP